MDYIIYAAGTKEETFKSAPRETAREHFLVRAHWSCLFPMQKDYSFPHRL